MGRGSRFGVTLPLPGLALGQHGPLLPALEDAGVDDCWTLETAGADAFTPLAFAAGLSRRLRLGTAVAGVFQRGPALLAMQAAALADAAPGRFVLGIGASSETIVHDWNGLPFERPFSRVRDTLAFLRRALAGERVDVADGSFRVRGFRLERPPAAAPPIHLAALRERMLRLAGRAADGVILSLVAPTDVPRCLGPYRAAGGKGEVVLRLGVLALRDAARARAIARRTLAAYLAGPPYAAFHAWLGRGETVERVATAWRRGDRAAAEAAVPDALVDGLFVTGTPEACRARIREFVAAGVTTPVVSLMAFEGDVREALLSLTPAAD